ncbi:unnamed protein product, partial [Polarella glacialis]
MGGMRAAGHVSGLPFKVVAAYEVSDLCAQAYRHNYGSHDWRLQTIERLHVEELDALNADVWLMSPPCQPFTRSGLRKDHEDDRTRALLHLVDVLGQMKKPPRRLLLENVVGFEVSESRRRLLVVLAAKGWEVAEFALDPEDFGLPNRRPRYYGLFRPEGDTLWPHEDPSLPSSVGRCHWRSAAAALEAEEPLLQGCSEPRLPHQLADFLQDDAAREREELELACSLEVDQQVMQDRLEKEMRSDIHLPTDRTSACLTKVNGRLPRGHSPLIVMNLSDVGPLEERPKVSSQGLGPSAATDHIWRPGVRLCDSSDVVVVGVVGVVVVVVVAAAV